MINISLTSRGFSVRGHAMHGRKGYDIVCSAVSALTQTFAEAIEVECKGSVNDYGGVYSVEVRKPTEESKMLIRALTRGLEHIERDYPKHLQLRIQRGVM